MSLLTALTQEAVADLSLLLVVGLFVTASLVGAFAKEERHRIATIAIFVVVHLLAVFGAACFRAGAGEAYIDVHLLALLFGAIAAVGMAVLLIFAVLLARIGIHVSRILRDVIGAAAFVVMALSITSHAGFNVQGLIATSAVATAVIGLALQDSIGNVFGGLLLQLDSSISAGDWIKLGDLSGKVLEVRWRFTAIETRNWETMIVPNSFMVKNQVLVLGRRSGKPHYWRRWVWFNVDFRFSPTDVIEAVNTALAAAPIERVAADPKAHCILMDLHESYGRYAVRYWLTDIAVDDPTDSQIRTRIYFALKRAGMPLSLPSQHVFLTEESSLREEETQKDLSERLAALHKIDLLKELSDDDLKRLAASLRYSPFCGGEVLTRQGAEAHWLYTILDGQVSVRVAQDGIEEEIARLGPGNFFGEMGLMTGDARSATVVALSDVECFRLDKAAFQQIIRARPELAEHIAEVLAARSVGLSAAKEHLDHEAKAHRMAMAKSALLEKVRTFFGLDEHTTA
jgi:small-conductance mechanosensitive channel